MINTEHRPYL